MQAILGCNVQCVNAMWQSSRSTGGPRARIMATWGENSLVSELVRDTLARCRTMQAATDVAECAWKSWLKSCEMFLTVAERVALTRVCKAVGRDWPDALCAQFTVVLLRRLVFARCVGEVMDAAGLAIEVRFAVAGHTTAFVQEISIDALVEGAQCILRDWRVLALALLLSGAELALDSDAERALRGLIKGREGTENMKHIMAVLSMLKSF
jgi:hypothetical protein